jgi:hypothetical protein
LRDFPEESIQARGNIKRVSQKLSGHRHLATPMAGRFFWDRARAFHPRRIRF